MAAAAVRRSLSHAGELILIDAFGIVEQTSDEGTLAVVHAAGSRETKQTHLKVALALLDLHGTFLIVIDHAVLTFRAADQFHFVDNLVDCVSFRMDRASAGDATE